MNVTTPRRAHSSELKFSRQPALQPDMASSRYQRGILGGGPLWCRLLRRVSGLMVAKVYFQMLALISSFSRVLSKNSLLSFEPCGKTLASLA